MKFIKSSICGLLFCFSVSSVADTGKPESVGCDAETGICFVNLSASVSGSVCGNKSQLRIDPSLAGAEGMYTAALSAFLGNKDVMFSGDGCFEGAVAPGYIAVTN